MAISLNDLSPKAREQATIKLAILEARKRKSAKNAAALEELKKAEKSAADSGGNKYHAEKIVVDGIKFDSKREAARYEELLYMERAGDISDLQRQVPFELIPAQTRDDGKKEKPVRYVADFVYWQDGKKIVEDAKGFRHPVYIVKRKLMLMVHGVSIKEV